MLGRSLAGDIQASILVDYKMIAITSSHLGVNQKRKADTLTLKLSFINLAALLDFPTKLSDERTIPCTSLQC